MAETEDEELIAAVRNDGDSDIDRIDPVPDTITLASGIEVHVLPLRTRELFKLLRIITHGAGQTIMQSGLDFKEDSAVFLQKLLGIVLFSIPDAENETVAFLQAMVEPADLTDKPNRDLSKAEREANIASWTRLNMEMYNPDPGDTIDILENVVRRESADLQALGKKLMSFLSIAARTGQLKAEPASNGDGKPLQDLNLPESSPASSTSSPPSTDGATSTSSASPSDGSGKSSPPSRRASGRKSAPAGA
jgi:hypothetical protein